MKKYTAYILVLGIVFFGSQLTAQVDSKTQGPTTTTEKKENTKSEIKTVPAVQSSKTGPGTTSSGTTKNPQSGTGTATTTKPGTVKSSSSKSTAGKMYDAGGNLLYTYDQLGYIRNAKNRVFCQLTPKGEIVRKRKIVGTVEKGIFRDRFGKEYARIVQEGKVVDAQSKPVGAIKDDGTVLNSAGAKIGSAPAVDKNAVVLIYFYKDVLDHKKGKSSVK